MLLDQSAKKHNLPELIQEENFKILYNPLPVEESWFFIIRFPAKETLNSHFFIAEFYKTLGKN